MARSTAVHITQRIICDVQCRVLTLYTAQVFNGLSITLSGTPAERAAALAQIEALPQVISRLHALAGMRVVQLGMHWGIHGVRQHRPY